MGAALKITTMPKPKTSTPKPGSAGEEALALHLQAYKIPFERETCLIPGRKWRWDFWIDSRLAVEIQGGTWSQGRHSRGAGQQADYRKSNAATKAKISVLYYSTDMVKSGEAIDEIRGFLTSSTGATSPSNLPSPITADDPQCSHCIGELPTKSQEPHR